MNKKEREKEREVKKMKIQHMGDKKRKKQNKKITK